MFAWTQRLSLKPDLIVDGGRGVDNHRNIELAEYGPYYYLIKKTKIFYKYKLNNRCYNIH